MLIWIVFIGIAIISYLVQANLKSKFEKYSQMPLTNGMTGKEVAEKMLRDNGIYDVTVTSTSGMLTDHYNPMNKTVNLSEGVYGSASVAAAQNGEEGGSTYGDDAGDISCGRYAGCVCERSGRRELCADCYAAI